MRPRAPPLEPARCGLRIPSPEPRGLLLECTDSPRAIGAHGFDDPRMGLGSGRRGCARAERGNAREMRRPGLGGGVGIRREQPIPVIAGPIGGSGARHHYLRADCVVVAAHARAGIVRALHHRAVAPSVGIHDRHGEPRPERERRQTWRQDTAERMVRASVHGLRLDAWSVRVKRRSAPGPSRCGAGRLRNGRLRARPDGLPIETRQLSAF